MDWRAGSPLWDIPVVSCVKVWSLAALSSSSFLNHNASTEDCKSQQPDLLNQSRGRWVFDFLRKKRSGNIDKNDSLRVIADNVFNMLALQRSILGDQSLEDDKGIKVEALGYLWGFVDAAIQIAGFDPSDGQIGPPITDQILRRLYSEDYAYIRYMNYLIDNMRHDKLLLKGAKYGCQQCIEWLNDNDFAPMGFARLILDGNQ